jgi:hypothetical protein
VRGVVCWAAVEAQAQAFAAFVGLPLVLGEV